jgi:hypothetical protein
MSVVTAGAPSQGVRRYQLESGLEWMTAAERVERGKEARAAVPRDSHAVFDPGPGRPDPIGLLEEQAKAVAAQSANIQGVSGASYTSAGFKQSLQAALQQLGAG